MASSSSSTRVFGRYCRALMAAAKSSAAAAATATPKVSRANGILKPVPVSPALGKFLGVSEVSRTEAVKKVWEYIKRNNLQNPEKKREIYCDEKLKTIFQAKDKVDFLEVARLLSPHFVKTS
uniref:DM2 domain-containing protein n=1 Tax=Davidia involucrata TaxID=16924 RepID=A0A5B7BWC4_DAVIN